MGTRHPGDSNRRPPPGLRGTTRACLWPLRMRTIVVVVVAILALGATQQVGGCCCVIPIPISTVQP